MAKGVSLSIASDTKDFVKGIKSGVIEPLENVSDELRDLAKDGDKAGDKLEDSMRGAQKATERYGDDIEALGTKLNASAKRGGQGLKDHTADATSAAARDLGELKQEAIQNASETFSSFDGSASSFADGIQGTFGGIVSSMGPVGMAIGAAGALGIGMFMGDADKAKEKTDEFKAKVSELAAELIDVGGDPAEALGAVADRLKELATNSEEGEINLAALHDAAGTSASGYKRLADAYAGNTDELKQMVDAERERLEVAEEAFNQDKRWDSATTERLKNARDGQRLIVEGLDDTIKITEEAEAQEAAWLASNGPAYEARADQLEAIQGELDNTISSWTEYQDKETGAIDAGAFIAGMATKREAIANFNANVQSMAAEFGLSKEETQAILDQGIDFAGPLQSIVDSGLAGAYAAEVQAAVSGGQSIIDGTPITSTVKADADTDNAEAKLDGAAEDRPTEIKAKAETKTADAALDATANKARTATIRASAETSAAERAIARLIEDRSVTVRVRVEDQRGVAVP